MRLVPARTVPKALSVIFGAVSIALVIAAPLGSFLGGIKPLFSLVFPPLPADRFALSAIHRQALFILAMRQEIAPFAVSSAV
jgi:hypothetical protein